MCSSDLVTCKEEAVGILPVIRSMLAAWSPDQWDLTITIKFIQRYHAWVPWSLFPYTTMPPALLTRLATMPVHDMNGMSFTTFLSEVVDDEDAQMVRLLDAPVPWFEFKPCDGFWEECPDITIASMKKGHLTDMTTIPNIAGYNHEDVHLALLDLWTPSWATLIKNIVRHNRDSDSILSGVSEDSDDDFSSTIAIEIAFAGTNAVRLAHQPGVKIQGQ